MVEQQANFQIYLIIAVAIVAMMVMAGAIILFVVFYQKKMIQEQLKRQVLEADYQQKMMRTELESQESERRRLAADLHDSIGGMLSTIRVGLITLGRSMAEPESIKETKSMLDDTITSVRRISHDLMPATLEKFGFLHAIKELCERFQATARITIDFEEEGEIPELETQRGLMVFRIVQELLNNAVKHARATLIKVSVHVADEMIITVEDNGIGFDADAQKADKQTGRGLGLFNMENRARLLGGTLTFKTAQQKGSYIILTLPVIHEKTT